MLRDPTAKIYLDVVYQCPYSAYILVVCVYWREFPKELVEEYTKLEQAWITYGPTKYRELIRKYRHKAYVEYRVVKLSETDKFTYCVEMKKKVYTGIDYCLERLIARAELAKQEIEIISSTNLHPDVWRVPYYKQVIMTTENISIEKFYTGAYAALLYKKELKLNSDLCLEFKKTYNLDFEFASYLYKNGLPYSINENVLEDLAKFVNKMLNTYISSERSHLKYLIFLPLYKRLPKWWKAGEMKWSGVTRRRLTDYGFRTTIKEKISAHSLKRLPLLKQAIRKPPEYLNERVVNEVLEWIEKGNRIYSKSTKVY